MVKSHVWNLNENADVLVSNSKNKKFSPVMYTGLLISANRANFIKAQ
jgi:hypothetical protein